MIRAGSAYLTLEMFKRLKRPGSEYYWQKFNNARDFSWKTGTSYGHKDAWGSRFKSSIYYLLFGSGILTGKVIKKPKWLPTQPGLLYLDCLDLPCNNSNDGGLELIEMDFLEKLNLCSSRDLEAS